MKAPPYFPFYQRDFVHSCRTEQMTADEIGALVMVMCQQWEAMGPISLDAERFAAYTGWDIRVARRLLARLIDLDKVKRSEMGLQSSRMAEEITKYITKVRAAEVREERKRASAISRTSAGSVANFSEKSERCSEELSEKANKNRGEVSREAPLPDIRYQISDKNPPVVPQLGDDSVPTQFEEWWQAYPPTVRKVGKGECLALFRQAITGQRRPGKRRQKILDHKLVTAEILLAAVKRYAATKPNPEFVPAPARWLNEARWLDGHEAATAAPAPWWRDDEMLARMTNERWRAGIAQFANGTWPVEKLGPPPGHHQCVIPSALIDELRLSERYTPAGISREQH